jgi:GT2 family glycosyltransferase
MVSIIIINFNTPVLTAECVKSIQAKTSEIDYEIIIVDNASSDNSLVYFKENISDCKIIESKKNSGFAAGNNLGIKHALGTEILLLNSDTTLLNNAVKITSEVLRSNASIGVVGARLEYPDGKIQRSCQPFPSAAKLFIEKLRLHKLFPLSVRSRIMQGFYFDYNHAGKPDWIWGTYFHFRKDLLKEFSDKKLPEDYFMYVEDMQWCYLIRRMGYEIVYEPSAKIIHHIGGSSGKRVGPMIANQNDFVNRYYSWWKKGLLKLAGYNQFENTDEA